MAEGWYGEALAALGETRPSVVVIDAGLATSMQTRAFARRFPERYFNLGIAEQNAVGVASGIARRGFTPLVHSFSNFLARRAHDQIALSVAWPGLGVKLIAGTCGLFDGRNGPSHTATDDLGTMAALPGFHVAEPADQEEGRELLLHMVDLPGPAYLRVRRFGLAETSPLIRREPDGGALVSAAAEPRLTLVACGTMLAACLEARALLPRRLSRHVDLVAVSTLKPFSAGAVRRSAARTRRLLVVENHVASGGFADAARRALGPDPGEVHRLGLPDAFLPAGSPEALLTHCGMTPRAIAERAAQLLRDENE